MCRIWEKQSFMNISRVSVSSAKLKKKQFQQDNQNFYWEKKNKSIKLLI